jgi:hypothetical protein
MKNTVLTYAAGLLGAAALTYLVATQPTNALMGVAALAFVVALAWAGHSASRLGILSAVLLIGIPLVPGLQETRQPQLFAMLAVSGSLLAVALALARRRKKRARVAYGTATILAVLTLLTVGFEHPDQFRLLVGLVLAFTVALPLAISAAADERELQAIVTGITVIAIIAAGIALVESVNRAPLIKFTAFQEHTSPLVAFRASSIFGHPLVLCVFLSFIALANIVRPRWDQSKWYSSRLITVGIPLAGAAVSGSRSIALFMAVGILSILAMRQDLVRRKGIAFAMIVASIGLGYFALSTDSALAARFGGLTEGEQAVRIGGLDVVMGITRGMEVFIGGGPRAVAAAYQTASGGAIFGTVDNQLLTSYADYGLVGLALVLALVVRLIVGLRRGSTGPWARALIVASMSVFAAFFVMDPLAWPILAFIFGLGAGAMTTKAPAPAPEVRSVEALPASRLR